MKQLKLHSFSTRGKKMQGIQAGNMQLSNNMHVVTYTRYRGKCTLLALCQYCTSNLCLKSFMLAKAESSFCSFTFLTTIFMQSNNDGINAKKQDQMYCGSALLLTEVSLVFGAWASNSKHQRLKKIIAWALQRMITSGREADSTV